ncbi:MAG: STAS domain-containing protein [Albidovulum sp.]
MTGPSPSLVPEPLILPARLDLTQAEALRQACLARRGQPLCIDAGGVRHLGALCLQVLLAAAKDWRQHGLDLQIAPRSAGFDAALGTFAVSLSDLQSKEAA